MSATPTTAGCDRFEHEGLELLERGEPLADHFETCPDCLAARRLYERLVTGLAEMPGQSAPGPWQARVWAEVARRGDRSRGRWWSWRRAGLPAGLLAAAVALFLMVWNQGPSLESPSSRVTFEAEWVPHLVAERRGGDARPGDSLRLRASLGGEVEVELRLYRDDLELSAQCSDQPPCHRDGKDLEASFPLAVRGTYQPILLFSNEPLPPGTGDLDADLGAAFESGARVELAPAITVR